VNESSRRTVAVGLAFVLALTGAGLLVFRAGRQVRRIDAATEPIHAWMSIPFIAHTNHVPAGVLFRAIGVQPLEPHDRRSVRFIAHELHRPVRDVIAQLQLAVARARSSGGPSR
jgi:hypothetical protein